MDEVGYGLMEIISMIMSSVLTVAAIIASYVGLKGLSTWQRQLRGNTEYTLAKNILMSMYELREAISSIRSWIQSFPLVPDLPEEELKNMSVKKQRWYAQVQTYQKKWEPVSAARAKLRADLFEAEAVWGRAIVDKVNPIQSLINKLWLAITGHLEARDPNTPYEATDLTEARKRQVIMYEGGPENDDFKQHLEAAIREIEIELKPHITQHHN